jgi:hypothetical protein
MRKALLIVWISVLIHIILVNQLLAAKVAAAPTAYSIDRVLAMRGCVQNKKPKTGDSISYSIKGPILQNHLVELSRSKDVVRFRCDIDPTWQSRLRKYYIQLNYQAFMKNGYRDREIAGLLFAVSDSGCFLYDWETSIGTYVPYRVTSVINKGVPPRNMVKKIILRSTVLFTGIGLAGSGGLISLGTGAIIGAVSGLHFGAYVSMFYVVGYAITTVNPRVRYNVNASVDRGADFRKKMKTRHNLSRGIDIDQYTLDSAWASGWRDHRLNATENAEVLMDSQMVDLDVANLR